MKIISQRAAGEGSGSTKSGAVVKFVSYKEEVTNAITYKLQRNMILACQLVERDAKKNVSKTGFEHPQVQTGRLRASITYRVIAEDVHKLWGEIGSNVVYAKRLEFGFIGVDSLGRRYNQPPYPWLFPALESNREKIVKLLGQGVQEGMNL
jgi:hypothetical protein